MDWDQVRRHRWTDDEPPPDWPRGVKGISLVGLNLIGVDANNRLYWDGNRLELTYKLTFWQTAGAFVVGAFVCIASAATCVQAWVAWVSCPTC